MADSDWEYAWKHISLFQELTSSKRLLEQRMEDDLTSETDLEAKDTPPRITFPIRIVPPADPFQPHSGY